MKIEGLCVVADREVGPVLVDRSFIPWNNKDTIHILEEEMEAGFLGRLRSSYPATHYRVVRATLTINEE